MRGRRRKSVQVCLAVVVIAAGCSSGPNPAPLSPTLIAAFNDLYRNQHPATMMRPASSTGRVAVSEETAIAAASRSCNDGPGASLVAVGLVTVTGWGGALWAVFVDPPGSHFLPSAAGTGGVTANWFVVLINAQSHESRPWSCAAGEYARLPALPAHE
jgi:hypothetical protein